MPSYKLSPAAALDLEQIYDFGIDTFGLQQASNYVDALSQRFDELTTSPLLHPSVPRLGAGYRRSVCGVHSIYYRQHSEGHIEIVRIIHKQDY